VKDPDTTPAKIVQVELEKRPLGDDETTHAVSAPAKPEPEIATTTPVDPELGTRVILGVTVKVVAAESA
jgi:hypothetical protein